MKLLYFSGLWIVACEQLIGGQRTMAAAVDDPGITCYSKVGMLRGVVVGWGVGVKTPTCMPVCLLKGVRGDTGMKDGIVSTP